MISHTHSQFGLFTSSISLPGGHSVIVHPAPAGSHSHVSGLKYNYSAGVEPVSLLSHSFGPKCSGSRVLRSNPSHFREKDVQHRR